MQLFECLSAWRKFRSQELFQNQKIGFVPTMGNLHAGHASLLRKAREENDLVVLSVFVNPKQFNNPEDYLRYPLTLEQDLEIAKEEKVDFVLAPKTSDLYPDGYRYRVYETEVSQLLCGQFRPGHFEGVLTIVMKLFHLVKPHCAYFGEKDYQQFQLIEGMAKYFFMDIDIIVCPTIRDDAGLALSSRNSRLNEDELILAKKLGFILKTSVDVEKAKQALQQVGFKVEYIEDLNHRRYAAVYLGTTRLIDNVEI